MANTQPRRVSDETLPPGSALEQSGSVGVASQTAPHGVVSIRLSTGGADPTENSVWNSGITAACLTLDMISALGASPRPIGNDTLTAEFPSVTNALLAARRLQWALSGLAEKAPTGRVAATVLVCTDAEALHSNESLAKALGNAGQGQILLSGAVFEAVSGLPGVVLGSSSEGGWHELHENRSVANSGETDEQTIQKLLRELGRDDPFPPKVEAPPVPPAAQPISASRPVSAKMASASRPISVSRPISSTRPANSTDHVEAAPESVDVDDQVSARADRDSSEEPGNKKWLILGGAAAALILVVLILFGMHRKPTTAGAPTESAPAITTTSNSPAATSTASGRSTSPAKADIKAKPTTAGATLVSSKKSAKGEAVVGASKPVDAGPCDLTQAEIPRSLQRAENDMHAGRLEEAKAAFLGVRGCPGARERADEGLRQIQQAMSLSTGR